MVTVDRLSIGMTCKNLQVKVLQVHQNSKENISNDKKMEKQRKKPNSKSARREADDHSSLSNLEMDYDDQDDKNHKQKKKTILSAIVADCTGQIELTYRQNNQDLIKPGRIIEIVSGRVSSFEGRMQVQVGVHWGEIKRIREESLSSVKLLSTDKAAPSSLLLSNNLSFPIREYGLLLLKEFPDQKYKIAYVQNEHDEHDVCTSPSHRSSVDSHSSTCITSFLPPHAPAELNDSEKDAAVRAFINATDFQENDFRLLSHVSPCSFYQGNSLEKVVTFFFAILNQGAVTSDISRCSNTEAENRNSHIVWRSFEEIMYIHEKIKMKESFKFISYLYQNLSSMNCLSFDKYNLDSMDLMRTPPQSPQQTNTLAIQNETLNIQISHVNKAMSIDENLESYDNASHADKSQSEAQASQNKSQLLPVTVLSGFLGAGKTTLLNYILHQNHGYKIAVIVNDMAEVNIDAKLVQNENILKVEQSLVEMSNGCICCTLREDLLTNITELAKQDKFDYLVIESTGISEPLPVAETFTFEDENGVSLSQYARLDTLVTVVDAINFLKDFKSIDSLKRRKMQADETDTRTVVDLLRDQVEFANVILVNKSDLISTEQAHEIKKLIEALNPNALVYNTTFSQIDLSKILNTNLFKISEAEKHEQWLKEARFNEHVPESVEYGVSSFVYKVAKPFHPERLWKLVHESETLNNVVRSKGFFWLATDNKQFMVWSQAGVTWRVSIGGRWWADVRSSEHPKDLDKSQWTRQFGDRKQELIFIGIDMNQKEIVDAFDKCLLTKKELEYGSRQWPWIFKDPFKTMIKKQQNTNN